MQIVFPIAESALQVIHYCESQREGEWIVHTCKDCPEYERKVHYLTGQVKLTGDGHFAIDHIHGQLK